VNKRWVIAPAEPALASQLTRELSLPASVAQVLINRGFRDLETARKFLNPQLRQLRDPFELPDMTAAVNRLRAAITGQQRIVIYGDYDVDGVTSSALLYRVLHAAGATVTNFLPHRMDEGYGLSDDGVTRCVKEHRPELLVAVDCGTSSAREIAGLKEQGVDVVVLDHHEPPAELPACVAVVNPKRTAGEPFASVGVAFKVAHALLKCDERLADSIDLREHLDLVALGTVADIVSLTGENRILVKAGLERLAATQKIGLRTLMDVADVPDEVTPYHIGFRLGPRLNAAGRLADAMAALELLLTEDAGRAAELAQMLNQHNAERQQIEEDICREALAQARERADDCVLVVANPAWHPGVIGIVASRIVQQLYRPTVVIGQDGKGSCRSVSGFSIVAALHAAAPALERFGGHEMAAGLSVKAGRVDEVRRRLNEYARQHLKAEDLQPRQRVDAEVDLPALDADFFEALAKLEPCGAENPTPVFAVCGVQRRGVSRVIGRNHLKFHVTDGTTVAEAIWWGMAEAEVPAGPFDVAFTAELREYRGEESVQLFVKDIRTGDRRG
jgi:single-stranded-DNA-specific exonuclease